MKISVVIAAYNRIENLERILSAWLELTNDVYLADCSNQFETSLPITHVRFNPDPGNRSRHAVALLTKGDFVIKADDDVFPKKGIIEDFIRAQQQVGPGIFGIHGRVFQGKNYYKNTKVYQSILVKEPTPVDFVGIITFSPREFLAFDLKGCLTPIEDLFWQMRAFPAVEKWVIPSKNFEKLPESKHDCLFHNPEAREIRERFYQEYYLKNYSRGLSADAYSDYYKSHKIWKNLTHPRHRRRFRDIAAELRGSRFIDIGCVYGHSTSYLKANKAGDWSGLDFSLSAIKQARALFSDIRFYYSPDFNLKPVCGQFDSVVCSEVLEHVEEDRILAQSLLEITKQRAIVTVPSRIVDDPGHIRQYDEHSLAALFPDSNLRIRKDMNFYFMVINK